jgi:membrane-associated protease RseP (regulator of RpoE activity)
MGHFVYTLFYRVHSSFPYFLPMPISPVGTMGAVIVMDGRNANRPQIFDIGIAGPLAGLVVAAPILWLGVQQLDFTHPASGGIGLHLPIFIRWLIGWLRPGQVVEENIVWLSQANPYFVAAWFGLLITGLNMMPISQLDGGHITFTLFGRFAHWLARGLMVLIIAYITYTGTTIILLMVVLLLVIGTDHPPTADDQAPIGPVRWILGLASLTLPILCLHPRLFRIGE